LLNWKEPHTNHSEEKEVNSLNLRNMVKVMLAVVTFVLVGIGFSLPWTKNHTSLVEVAEAQDASHGGATVEEEEDKGGGKTSPWKSVAAAIALCGGALGTGIAQSRIGSAGVGAMVEKPEMATMAIVFLAIPETIVILAFVVAAMLIMF
jgi:V/A-type H+-transporting ATPase subunit K